jgi:hypothetical protein
MNPVFETRSPRNGCSRARANRDGQSLGCFDSTKSIKSLQVKRLCALTGCTQDTAAMLACLVFGEGRRD